MRPGRAARKRHKTGTLSPMYPVYSVTYLSGRSDPPRSPGGAGVPPVWRAEGPHPYPYPRSLPSLPILRWGPFVLRARPARRRRTQGRAAFHRRTLTDKQAHPDEGPPSQPPPGRGEEKRQQPRAPLPGDSDVGAPPQNFQMRLPWGRSRAIALESPPSLLLPGGGERSQGPPFGTALDGRTGRRAAPSSLLPPGSSLLPPFRGEVGRGVDPWGTAARTGTFPIPLIRELPGCAGVPPA